MKKIDIKKSKKINQYNIFVIIICLILYGYSIFIGSPIKDNTSFINILVLITFSIYLLTNLLKIKNYKLIKNKLDIFIILLVLSSYIALIFRNYSNLEATIEYIIKYTAILSMYIMVRDIVIKDKKYINYILITFMISSISIFILGLDNITYNIGQKFLNLTGNVEVLNQDKRFNSIFGYANTTAIYMLAISILAIGKYLTAQSKKEKIFYNSIIFINLTAIIISYSRATWLIAIIIYLLYLWIILLNENKVEKYLSKQKNVESKDLIKLKKIILNKKWQLRPKENLLNLKENESKYFNNKGKFLNNINQKSEYLELILRTRIF